MTDDWDRRCIMNILEDFYKPEVLTEDFAYSESGIYRQISTTYDLNVSTQLVNPHVLLDTQAQSRMLNRTWRLQM